MSSESDDACSGVEGGVYLSDSKPSAARAHLRVRPLTLLGVLAVAIGGAGAGGYMLASATQSSSDGLLSIAAHDEAPAYRASPPNRQNPAADYEQRLAEMHAEQDRLRTEIVKAEARHSEALGALEDTQRELDEVAGELERVLDTSAAESEEAAADTAALADAKARLAKLQLELAAAESARQGLNQTLATLAETMEAVIAERDAAAAKAETLDEQVAEITERQEKTLQAIQDAARLSLDGMREMFERTGLDVERILGETREDYSGSGGPFEALADQVSESEGEADLRVAALMDDLEKVNLMRFAAKRLPFGEPVETGRLTSNFGPRRDPLGRGRAMHKGIDFAGPKGTKILATADGVVTFSGAQRGYGRIVIVRHAFGVETRYAHLNRSRVKVGQRVKRGDHIADMGNTGRSTGTHLHYEIRIDREAVNPVNFLEAQTDVL